MDRTNSIAKFKHLFSSLLAAVIMVGSPMPAYAAPKELHVLSPANYLDPALLNTLEKEMGILIHPTYYYSVGMREHSLREGTNYDIVIVAAESARDYIAEHRAQKLPDVLLQRNRQAHPASEDAYGLFLSYTMLGVAYHATRATRVDSWERFFQLPQSLYGRVIVPSGHQDVMDAALLAIASNPETFSDKQVTEAGRLVFRATQRLGLKTPSESNELLDGTADYQVTTATEASLLHEKNRNIQFVIPSNHTRIRMQYALLPANSRNTELAIRFLDAISNDKGAQTQSDYHHFAVSNANVRQKILQKQAKNPEAISSYPADNIKISTSKHNDPRLEMRKAYIFERIKNAATY